MCDTRLSILSFRQTMSLHSEKLHTGTFIARCLFDKIICFLCALITSMCNTRCLWLQTAFYLPKIYLKSLSLSLSLCLSLSVSLSFSLSFSLSISISNNIVMLQKTPKTLDGVLSFIYFYMV